MRVNIKIQITEIAMSVVERAHSPHADYAQNKNENCLSNDRSGVGGRAGQSSSFGGVPGNFFSKNCTHTVYFLKGNGLSCD